CGSRHPTRRSIGSTEFWPWHAANAKHAPCVLMSTRWNNGGASCSQASGVPHCGAWGAVAILRLNRPQKRNALNDEAIVGIEQFFSSLPDGIGAVLIAGEGGHFSAGLDLSELEERDVTQGIAHSNLWHRAFEKIQFGKVPAVAVLHGAVVGGGLELAAATHVRVAERSAYYALPEGSRGIYVGGGGSVRLPRLIGT